MGLAPYGSAAHAWRPCARSCGCATARISASSSTCAIFRHHREAVAYEWAGGSPQFGDLFSPELEDLLGPRRLPDEPLLDRHRDIARSVQAMYEEAFFHLVLPLQRRSGLTAIALAGGCAMNSVANGKIRRITPFQRVYVQSAAGDAGGAIGAAFAVWHQQGGGRSFVMDHAYWGPSFGQDAIAALLTRTACANHRKELLGRGARG